jgi:hypothetical protein
MVAANNVRYHAQFKNGAAPTDQFVAFRGSQIPVLMGLG